jgi:corrinoid protein of di/trimethylamine methyltransferase
MELINKMKQAMIDIDEDKVAELLLLCLDKYDPDEIIEKGLGPGIREIGNLFESGDYFLPELMVGAEIMKSAMGVLEPLLSSTNMSIKNAQIVIGTVQGDIHDIGKTLVGSMLTASGYTVHDLGSDVPTDVFINKIKDTSSKFLCLSALLTTTMGIQRDIIDKIRKEGLDVKILVGGAPVNQKWADEIRADGYAANAVDAVRLIDQMV